MPYRAMRHANLTVFLGSMRCCRYMNKTSAERIERIVVTTRGFRGGPVQGV